MLFVSSTKYLNIKWGGHFVVILVSFVTRSNPVLFIAPAGRLYAWKKMAGSVSLEYLTIQMVKMMYS